MSQTRNNKLADHEGRENGEPVMNKKLLVGAVGMAALVIMLGIFYLHHGRPVSVSQTTDEVYTVPTAEEALPAAPVTFGAESHPVPPVVTASQVMTLQAKQKELEERLTAPLMVVSGNASEKAMPVTDKASQSNDANRQFMADVGSRDVEVSYAMGMADLGSVLAAGSFIHATLETAINSDLPGMVRASVSEPVYAEDGSRVLVPRGSRLIGEYKSGLLQGQSRVFVVWTRLLTPEGVTVGLGSPGVDNLGMAGMGADGIDRHFWAQFGRASLLSLIGAGAANVGGSGNESASAYREAVASSFSQSANQSLQENVDAPTLTVNQGRSIVVFVAKDLDFASAQQANGSSVRVF